MGSSIALTLTLTLTLTLLTLSLADTGKIAVYWGQDLGDGTLASTCQSGNYKIVILSFLKSFGCARPTVLDLDGHCGVQTGIPCTELRPEIQSCQRKGVKVLLALGGPNASYSLCSEGDAKVVANELYANYLSGVSSGPLGSVTLDGIHFDIQTGTNLYWDDLLQELYNIRDRHTKARGNYFSLSAAPKCSLTDPYLDTAINTGNFDYIFLRFYDSPICQYSSSGGGASSLIDYWNAWTSKLQPSPKLFLELPAAPDAAGYIPPSNLISEVLPYIKQTSSYNGVALWDRSHDAKTLYSIQIKPYVSLSHPTNTLLASVTDA